TGFTSMQDILFGDRYATQWTVNSATSLTVTAPPAPAGTVDVTVVNAAGPSASTSADRFTYLAFPAPAGTALSATRGTTAGGTLVTITGTNLSGATSVLFGSPPAAYFAVNNDYQVTAVSPSQAAGVVDVTVTTPTGTSASTTADRFTYTAAP